LCVSRDGFLVVLSFRQKQLIYEDTLDAIDNEVSGLLADPSLSRWIIDFTGVDVVVSKLLNVVLRILQRVRATHGEVVVCGLGTNLKRMFELMKLDQIFQVYPTQVEAKAVQTGGQQDHPSA
jgi:anti-sigma B factor antagonist